MIPEKDSSDLLDISPQIPIERLNFSRRTLNGLKNHGINFFSDLEDFNEYQLVGIPNLGKKSVDEIVSFLFNFNKDKFIEENKNLFIKTRKSKSDLLILENTSIAILMLSKRSLNALIINNILTIGQLISLNEDDFLKFTNLGKKSADEIQKVILKINTSEIQETINKNIYKTINQIIEGSFAKYDGVIKQRIFNGLTLEECGELSGVTRERVRQVESKFLRKLKLTLGDQYKNEILSYLKERNGIMGFLELNKVGHAYKNIAKELYSSKNPKIFLESLFIEEKLARWQLINNDYYFYPYAEESIDDFINSDDIINYIEKSKSLVLHEIISTYCLIYDQRHNQEYILKKIRERLSDNITNACNYAVTQLKKEFDKISINQIINFIEFNCEKDFSTNFFSIVNILSKDVITKHRLFLISGGDYFFLDKLNLSDKSKTICAELAIKFMREDVEKNHRAPQVYDFIKYLTEFQEIPKEEQLYINGYVLNAILKEMESQTNNLFYTGRSTWSVKDNLVRNNRTEVAPAVVSILEINGKPMLLKDIKEELLKVRGVGSNFQLTTTLSQNKIIAVSEGMWGLRNRDLDVSTDEENNLVRLIMKSFKQDKKILDFYDILQFKDQLNINEDVSVYKLMRMLFSHIPSGRRKTPDKLIFLIMISRSNSLNFCIYSPEIKDKDAKEYIKLKINDEFLDVRNNEDSIKQKGVYGFSESINIREYVIEDKIYFGREAVAKAYGISAANVGNRAASYKYPDWKIITKFIENDGRANSQKLIKEYLIENKVYLGREAVAKEYGINIATVGNRVNSFKFPDWKLNE